MTSYPPWPQEPQGQYPQYPPGQSYPLYGAGAGGGPPVSRPSVLKVAAWLMCANAALAIAAMVLVLTYVPAKQVLADLNPDLSQHQIDAGWKAAIGLIVLFFLVVAGLWIWMAVMNWLGRPWARVLSTVFFSLFTLLMLWLLSLAKHGVTPGLAIIGAGWLAGLTALVLVWQRAATAYYVSARR